MRVRLDGSLICGDCGDYLWSENIEGVVVYKCVNQKCKQFGKYFQALSFELQETTLEELAN